MCNQCRSHFLLAGLYIKTRSVAVDLCQTPGGFPPDINIVPNFVDPPTLGPVTLSLGILMASFSVLLTAGRLWMNRRKMHSADWFTLVGCIINTAFTGIVLAQHRYNRHQWDIPVCWFTASYFRILYIQATLFAPVFFTTKAALILLYRQIFSTTRNMRIAINIGLVFTLLLYLPNIPLAAIFSAPRVGETWESMLTAGRSRRLIIWGIIQSALSIVLDIYIFIMPLPTIIHLNMPLSKRLQLLAPSCLAAEADQFYSAVLVSVLSLIYRIELNNTNDASWPQSQVAICASLVETNVALIVCCMPAAAQLFKIHVGGSAIVKYLRSRLRGATSRSGSDPSSDWSKDNKAKAATFGSGPQNGRRNYYELTEASLLKSQVVASGDRSQVAPDGIVQSVEFTQESRHGSTERLA
ncbi:hypothetical protein B0I35DRAFT_454804 [Stachybotrys elegans]|uniref:Rhodopsin domain-containing protein n=1 Tax=Stachybotrys elegans TaxID=80388 RepID=A0A8K0SEL8_9HYPO|nr:hypothetical protein B0I35DRAFT_454804 [Stachybotrys elegans]